MLRNQELVRDWLNEEGKADLYMKLCSYSALISKWKDRYSIMGGDEDERWRLIGESLLAVDLIKGGYLIDIGSGGGMPAIPICLAVNYRKIVFVEPNERKAYILSEIVEELEIKDIEICLGQVENFSKKRKFDIITMRGIPLIRRLLKVIIELLINDGTTILFTHKIGSKETMFLENSDFNIYNKEHKISGFKGLLYFRRKET
jgi:16S rRNA (guanine527-N7)-methyltransferase